MHEGLKGAAAAPFRGLYAAFRTIRDCGLAESAPRRSRTFSSFFSDDGSDKKVRTSCRKARRKTLVSADPST